MTYLLIDVKNLAHRHFSALPVMFRHNDESKGRAEAVFGFLRELIKLDEDFPDAVFAFFFEGEGESVRKSILPSYKCKSEESKMGYVKTSKDRKYLKKQLHLLHDHVLPELGFTNVFRKNGYEADDLIACGNLFCYCTRKDTIVVSSDRDFYQLLCQTTSVYDPGKKKMITEQSFRRDYGIWPYQWINVKAIAGDTSDSIPGVDGVGEATALKWEQAKIGPDSGPGKKIHLAKKTIDRNKKIIRLPYEGAPPIDLAEERMDYSKWPKVLKKLGVRLEILVDV